MRPPPAVTGLAAQQLFAHVRVSLLLFFLHLKLSKRSCWDEKAPGPRRDLLFSPPASFFSVVPTRLFINGDRAAVNLAAALLFS